MYGQITAGGIVSKHRPALWEWTRKHAMSFRDTCQGPRVKAMVARQRRFLGGRSRSYLDLRSSVSDPLRFPSCGIRQLIAVSV